MRLVRWTSLTFGESGFTDWGQRSINPGGQDQVLDQGPKLDPDPDLDPDQGPKLDPDPGLIDL